MVTARVGGPHAKWFGATAANLFIHRDVAPTACLDAALGLRWREAGSEPPSSTSTDYTRYVIVIVVTVGLCAAAPVVAAQATVARGVAMLRHVAVVASACEVAKSWATCPIEGAAF